MIAVSEPTAARRQVIFQLVDRTDNSTPETGITLTVGGSEVEISKNGAAFGTSAGTAAEVGGGYYSYQFTTGEVDTIGTVRLKLDDAAAAIDVVEVEVRAAAQVYGDAYQGKIWIDPTNGTSGSTVGIHGTTHTPCTTAAEADTLSAALGLKHWMLLDGTTTLNAADYVGYIFEGRSQGAVCALNSKNLESSSFMSCQVTGTAGTGAWYAERCILLGTNIGAALEFFRCLFSGDITVAAGLAIFHQCGDLHDGGGIPNFDFNGVNTDLVFVDWTGDIGFDNLTHASASAVVYTKAGGLITVTAACTDGALTLEGLAGLSDSSAGTTVTSTRLVDPQIVNIANGVMLNNVVHDNLTIDANGFVSARRMRVYNSLANADLATDGGSETAGLIGTCTASATVETGRTLEPGFIRWTTVKA